MKPIIILPPDVMSEENIKLLRENDLCVVIAKDPCKVKFVDPIPAVSSRTQMETAALKLSRVLLNGAWGNWTNANLVSHSDIARIYTDILIAGTPLDKNGSNEEREQRYFNDEKMSEIRRLAREDAKAERAAAKTNETKK